ncbi:ViGiLN-like protein [Aphelenchoides besseyi]|nr:ViGiLN-like protein [Aphelenchoides besseyi]
MSNAEVYAPQELNGVNGFSDQQPTAQPTDFVNSAPMNGLTVGQPGSSKATAHQQSANGTKLVMDYSTDFPKLPEAKAPSAPTTGAWARRLTSAVVTETFKLSSEERAAMNLGSKSFGQAEQQKCGQVAASTNTKIELCESSDKSLTVLITGKKSDVDDAHSRLIRELQTQASIEVTVPREFHGSIIGRDGQRRKQLENEYHCRFYMPRHDENSDVVRIVGPIEQVKEAANRLRDIVSDLASRKTETLQIPKTFYPWIRGAFNETVDAIQAETGVKINIPPPRSSNETIVISGETEGVTKAVAKVRAIYESKKNVKSVTCKVARAQHRFIIGQQRSGLDEIFRETEVVVEVPAEEENSDTLTLRGPQEKLGEALTLVYSRASSIISLQLKYPEWQKPFLLGKKGSKLQELVPKQDRLNVEFEDGGVIYIEGPPEAIKSASTALQKEIDRLTKEMASEVVKVPSYLHRHIIGRQGASISKIKNDFDVQITIPDEHKGSDEIKIEGRKENVKKAVAEIRDQATKLEQKMPKDQQPPAVPAEETERTTIDIDPRFHKNFVSRGAEVLREIQQKHSGVIISFPKQETNDSKVQIRGPKTGVQAAIKELNSRVNDFERRGYKTSVEVPLAFHPRLIGSGGANIREFSKKYDVHIHIPRDNTEIIEISGYEEKANAAKAEIEKQVAEFKNLVNEEVDLDPRYHKHFMTGKAEAIRDIQQRYQGVVISFPRQDSNDSKVHVRGPREGVEAAIKELTDRVEDCRLREYKTSVEVPVSFHSRLIGPGGANIREFSKKYDVHIHIPRDESNVIQISGYEEKANEAKAEIQRQYEEFKNMITMEIKLDPRFHPRLIGQRRKNLKKIEDDYKVEITIPNRSDEDPSRVLVSGRSEEAVLDCLDKLRTLEEDFMQDVVESGRYEYHRQQPHHEEARPQHIEITGAPWQLDSLEQFPSFGGSNEQQANSSAQQPSGVWGRR